MPWTRRRRKVRVVIEHPGALRLPIARIPGFDNPQDVVHYRVSGHPTGQRAVVIKTTRGQLPPKALGGVEINGVELLDHADEVMVVYRHIRHLTGGQVVLQHVATFPIVGVVVPQ